MDLLAASRNQSLPVARYHGKPISASLFRRHVQAMANHLLAQSSDRIRLVNLCSNRYHFLVSFCAAIIAGRTTLLPQNRHPATLRTVINESSDYCLVDSIDESLPWPQIQFVLDEAEPGTWVLPPEDIAATVFTSGSTGTPSKIDKPLRALLGAGTLLAHRFALHQPATILATVPSQHMYGLEMTIMMVLQGDFILDDRQPFFPADIHHAITDINEPVLLVTTPVHLRALLKSGLVPEPLAGIISATAPLSQELASAAELTFGVPLHEDYGCSEAGSIATRRTAHADYWQPLDHVVIESDSDSVKVVAPYLDKPVPLQDELVVREDGTFRLLGRSADFINIAGKKVSVLDLTAKIMSIDTIEDAVVFLPDDSGQRVSRPSALVVTTLSETEVVRQLADRVDHTFIPRPIIRVDKIPREQTGKIPREALMAIYNVRKNDHKNP